MIKDNNTAMILKRINQLETDIQRENFLRENKTAMISDREYLYLLFALHELHPDSTVLGETKLGDAIQNFEKKVKKTLQQMDKEEGEGNAEDADAGEEVKSEEEKLQNSVNSAVLKNIAKNTMTKTEIEELLNKAKQKEPVKKKRSKRSVR